MSNVRHPSLANSRAYCLIGAAPRLFTKHDSPPFFQSPESEQKSLKNPVLSSRHPFQTRSNLYLHPRTRDRPTSPPSILNNTNISESPYPSDQKAVKVFRTFIRSLNPPVLGLHRTSLQRHSDITRQHYKSAGVISDGRFTAR